MNTNVQNYTCDENSGECVSKSDLKQVDDVFIKKEVCVDDENDEEILQEGNMMHMSAEDYVCEAFKDKANKSDGLQNSTGEVIRELNATIEEISQLDSFEIQQTSVQPSISDVSKDSVAAKNALPQNVAIEKDDESVYDVHNVGLSKESNFKDSGTKSDSQQKEDDNASKDVYDYNVESGGDTEKNSSLQLLHFTDDRPHVCNVCLKTFARKGHLQRHLLTHTKEKSFLCNICQKTFSQKCHLQQHYLTHTKEKPHSCDVCNKSFNHKSSLHKHYVSHINPKNYVCSACKKAFFTQSELDEHFATHTEQELCYYALKNGLTDDLQGQLAGGAFQDVFSVKTDSQQSTATFVSNELSEEFLDESNDQQPPSDKSDHLKTDCVNTTGDLQHIVSSEECIYDVNSVEFSQESSTQDLHTSVKDYVCDAFKDDSATNSDSGQIVAAMDEDAYDISTDRFPMEILRGSNNNHLTPSKERPHVCHLCNKAFKLKNTLQGHYLTHTKEKPHVCDVCKRAFAHRSNLLKHCLIHTQEKPYVCDVCNKGFTQKGSLMGHYLVHTKEKPYVCNVCSRAFSQRSNLYKHLATHAIEKPHVCEICSKAFYKKCSLQAHLQTHTEEKKHVCEICDKAFALKTYLIKHYVRHELENPHVCNKDLCGQSCPHFRKNNRVKEKKHICDVCNKAFSKRYHLERHQTIHTRDKDYLCNVCNKAFSQKSSLQLHSQVHAEKPYECDICGKTFSSKDRILKHYKIHKKQEDLSSQKHDDSSSLQQGDSSSCNLDDSSSMQLGDTSFQPEDQDGTFPQNEDSSVPQNKESLPLQLEESDGTEL